MKIRILTLMAAIMLAASFSAGAQMHPQNRPGRAPSGHGAFRGVGLTFGYVNSTYRTVDLATDEPTTSKPLHGFTAGITKDFTLLRHALYLQTGLNYIYQNQSRNDNIKIPATDLAIRLVGDREEHHLGIPVRLKYDVHVVDNIGLTFDAGPTLLMGLSAKYKYRTRLSENTITAVDYNIFNQKVVEKGSSATFDLAQWMENEGMYPEGKVKRFDVMLGASVGAHFFHILEVRLGYDWGLINRYRGQVADMYNMRRGQFTLSAGVRF